MANNKKRMGWTWLNLLISIAVLVLVIIIFVKKEKKEGYGCYAPSAKDYGCCPPGQHKCNGGSVACCKNIPCKEMFEFRCNCPKDCDECKLYTCG